MTEQSPWASGFEPPVPPRTDRIRLEVLGPDVVELDYAALMSSRERLREELGWGGARPWPADDFTLEENLQDLVRHRNEYDRREGYAYTVLEPSRRKCMGCIYLRRHGEGAMFEFWVTDEQVQADLEAHLLDAALQWIRVRWPPLRVWIALRPENTRSMKVVESLGLLREAKPSLPGYVSYAWTAGG